MAEQPTQPKGSSAPDTASTYERSRPEDEAGQGRLDNNQATPEKRPDSIDDTVKNKQPSRQINADDVVDQRATEKPT